MSDIKTFLKDNPNSTKDAIGEAISQKGLVLFNLLRKLQSEGAITSNGEGQDTTYSLVESEKVEVEEPQAIQHKAGKDTSKFKFEGELYGKGPLVRAVVTKYVEDNAGVTYKQLKDVFPDELLKRFGIFQDVSVLATPKMKVRYFSKEEQQIQVKGKRIVVCNQFTSENIQPFLKVARQRGYKIK